MGVIVLSEEKNEQMAKAKKPLPPEPTRIERRIITDAKKVPPPEPLRVVKPDKTKKGEGS